MVFMLSKSDFFDFVLLTKSELINLVRLVDT